MEIQYTKQDIYIAYLEIISALGLVGFWIGWFLDVLKSFQPSDSLYEIYMAYESAFPIADAWIVVLLLISAYGILTDKFYGLFCAAAAGGGLVFLGLLDTSFNLQQGVYYHDLLAIPINLAAIAGGGVLLLWFRRKIIMENQ